MNGGRMTDADVVATVSYFDSVHPEPSEDYNRAITSQTINYMFMFIYNLYVY